MSRRVGVVLISAVLLSGCGDGNPTPPKGVTVTGKVLNEGSPLTAVNQSPGDAAAEIFFVPLDKSVGQESEKLGKDGSFREVGAGNGIPAGKYKLVVKHYAKGRGQPDGLGDAFSEANTPIEVDLPADKVGGTHDLGTIELKDHMKK